MAQEPRDSPLALHLERGKTISVRCEEHAYWWEIPTWRNNLFIII